MTIKITRDTKNYRDGAGVSRPVDTVTLHGDPDQHRRGVVAEAVFHYFNDGMGITVGVEDDSRMSVINISRDDTLALLVRLNELFGVKH